MTREFVNIDGDRKSPLFMRRFFENYVSILIADAIVVRLSLVLANIILVWIKDIPFSITNGYLIVPAWMVVSTIARLNPGWGLGVVDELKRIQGALFVMFSFALLVSFFLKANIASSRITFLLTYVFCSVSIPLVRAVTRALHIRFSVWGIPVSIYGNSHAAGLVIDALRAEAGLGYVPSVIFSDQVPTGTIIKGVSVVGNLHNITSRTPVAIITSGDKSRRQMIDTLEGPLETYRKVILIPDLDEAPSLWVQPRDLQGILGLEITKNLLNPFACAFKRVIDLVLVWGTMPLWVPMMAFLYVLIWLEDRKDPMFLQPRIGRGGDTFRTAKFRTMVPNAEKVLEDALKKDPALKKEWEAHYKLKKDPRITKVGSFLRKTSLDEIPQLLNVLNGTMSLVGPRPLPKYHFDQLPEQVRFLRHRVRPGITGLWQVSGRSEAGTEGMEKWDPYYVRNWSIWLDIVIIARTFKAVFCGTGAY